MAISDLKGSINAKIKTNGSQSITGAVLNEVLNEMVNELDVASELSNKVDKEVGKGLSTNDFTTSEKEKLAELQNYDDAELRGEVESLQTEVDSHDVAIEDLQDNKVDKGDYAPALTAGFADNLVSKDIVVDSEFNLRMSGGGAISDGVARMEVVKGNSVVWNQRFKRVDMVSNGVTSTYLGEGVYELSGSATESYFNVIAVKNIIVGHQYLLMAKLLTNPNNIASMRFEDLNDSSTPKVTMPANSYAFGLASISRNTHSFGLVGFGGAGVDFTGVKIKVTLYDLTQMFGAGNEPTTIDEFYARKPIVEDEYAYNEGEVIHCNVDAVKSVGRNLFNIQNIQVGGVSDVTGAVNNDADSYNTGYVNVLPNTAYYIRTDATSGRWGAWYDSDKQYISGIAGGGLKTSPSNAAYLRMTIVSDGDGNPETFCINLSDPDFNGQYEPYKEDVRELPSAIKEVFPNGMMSAGTAHDVAYNDLNKEVGVTEKRIGVVDLGTFPWYKSTDGYDRVLWKAANLNNLGIVPNNNILCDRYVAKTKNTIYYDAVKGIHVNSEANGLCFLYDSQYDDYDATAFKAAMAGVQLYYELAEPIVTEHQEPFNLDYQVTNGGQEQAMATEPTSAFKADIAYGFNASAKIKENANEIASLKATIAQLQAALASMVSVTNNEIDNA